MICLQLGNEVIGSEKREDAYDGSMEDGLEGQEWQIKKPPNWDNEN